MFTRSIDCMTRASGPVPSLDQYVLDQCVESDDPEEMMPSGWLFSDVAAQALEQLLWRFAWWLVQDRGMPWPRAWMASNRLGRHLDESVEGYHGTDIPRPTSASVGLLCPPRVTVKRAFRDHSLAELSGQQPAALALALAHWPDFLAAHGLLDVEACERTRKNWRPVVEEFIRSLENEALDTTLAPIIWEAWG